MNICKKLILVVVAVVLNVSVGFAQTSPYATPDWGNYTIENGFILAHVVNWPANGKLVIDSNIRLTTATLFADPKVKYKASTTADGLTINLPKTAPDTSVTVLKLDLLSEDDWANLKKYSKANKELKPAAKGENRVVFMGNSITERWVDFDPTFFAENNFVGRGISGQTSPQMLLRFKQDVIHLNPKVVIINAGTNDIAGNRGPITLVQIADNIFSMAELAKANNIKVVLASVLPANSYSWSPTIQPADQIIQLNAMIAEYAKKNKIVYLDYYSALVDAEKGLKKEYGRDSVHPNLDGYKVMEPLVKAAIKKVM